MRKALWKALPVALACLLTVAYGESVSADPRGYYDYGFYPPPAYYYPLPPVYMAPRQYYVPAVPDRPRGGYAYYPPPHTYYEPEWVETPPPRPRSCGKYRYWNGEYCADARYQRPYVGPRW